VESSPRSPAAEAIQSVEHGSHRVVVGDPNHSRTDPRQLDTHQAEPPLVLPDQPRLYELGDS
jgi:hypothetical protein